MANIAKFYPESLINSYPRLKISDNTNIGPEILEDPALKLTLLRLLNTPTVARGYKIPRGIGKSRALLSRQTGMDCFDLDCIIPNLTKEGSEHFIQFASDALAKKE